MKLNKTVLALMLMAGSSLTQTAYAAVNAQAADTVTRSSIAPAHKVSFDTGMMLGLRQNSLIYLDLPVAGKVPVVFEHTTGLVNGVAYWEGHAPQDKTSRVSLKYDGLGWSGIIDGPNGKLVVGHVNGESWLTAVGADYQPGLPDGVIELFAPVASMAGGKLAFPGELPAKVSHPVRLNLKELVAVKENSEVALNLPGVGNMSVVFERSEATENGNTNWIGYLRDWGTDYRVVLTFGAEGVFGRILTPDGEFQLESSGGEQWLVDVAASGLSGHFSFQPDAILPPAEAGMMAEKMAAAAKSGGAAKTRTTTSGSTTTTTTTTTTAATTTTTDTTTVANVDVLILYTDGLAKRLGTGLTVRLDNLLAMSNQAYVDSGVKMKLRMVAGKQVAYTDQNSNSTALSELFGRTVEPFKNVATLRDSVGADLVTLIRPFYATAQVSCGVGYVGGYNGAPISYYSNYAYSVVSDGRDMKGSSYYCTDYTLVHEFGHNMGSMHDRATVASQGGGKGAYPYSFGYGKSGKFGTIMSYINPRVGKFSNPAVYTCANEACGVSETDLANSANNALSLTNVRAAVANFRATKVAASNRYSLNGVVNYAGIGLANVLFTPSDTSVVCGASGSNGAFSCTAPAGWIGTITPVLAGYTFTPTKLSFSNVQANVTSLAISASK